MSAKALGMSGMSGATDAGQLVCHPSTTLAGLRNRAISGDFSG
jgi:hypothetical protein